MTHALRQAIFLPFFLEKREREDQTKSLEHNQPPHAPRKCMSAATTRRTSSRSRADGGGGGGESKSQALYSAARAHEEEDEDEEDLSLDDDSQDESQHHRHNHHHHERHRHRHHQMHDQSSSSDSDSSSDEEEEVNHQPGGSAGGGLPPPSLQPSPKHGKLQHQPLPPPPPQPLKPSPSATPPLAGGPRPPLRRGKWTFQEEAYVSRIIHDFNHGLLPLAAGTTLRAYLSDTLNCDPMRITKKFAGAACIGKRVFQPCDPSPDNMERRRQAQAELEILRKEFLRTTTSSMLSSSYHGGTSLVMPLHVGPGGASLGSPSSRAHLHHQHNHWAHHHHHHHRRASTAAPGYGAYPAGVPPGAAGYPAPYAPPGSFLYPPPPSVLPGGPSDAAGVPSALNGWRPHPHPPPWAVAGPHAHPHHLPHDIIGGPPLGPSVTAFAPALSAAVPPPPPPPPSLGSLRIASSAGGSTHSTHSSSSTTSSSTDATGSEGGSDDGETTSATTITKMALAGLPPYAVEKCPTPTTEPRETAEDPEWRRRKGGSPNPYKRSAEESLEKEGQRPNLPRSTSTHSMKLEHHGGYTEGSDRLLNRHRYARSSSEPRDWSHGARMVEEHHKQERKDYEEGDGRGANASLPPANHNEGELLLDFLITVRRQHEEKESTSFSSKSASGDDDDSPRTSHDGHSPANSAKGSSDSGGNGSDDSGEEGGRDSPSHHHHHHHRHGLPSKALQKARSYESFRI